MLWNPNKDKPKVEPLSLEGLVQWLETQDPKMEYDYCNKDTCVWANYMMAIGNEKIAFRVIELPPGVNSVVQDPLIQLKGAHQDWTYGGALKRGKEALARQGK